MLESGSDHSGQISPEQLWQWVEQWSLNGEAIFRLNEGKVENMHAGFLEGTPLDAPALPDNFLKLYPRTPSLALWRYEEVLAYGSRRAFPGLTLDLGCGDGSLFAWCFSAERAIGMDSDRSALRHARAGGVYQQVVAAKGESLPFKKDIFSYVFSNCVLEHTEAPQRVLGEVERLLRPGGALVCSILAKESEKWFLPSRVLSSLGFRKKSRDLFAAFNRTQTHRSFFFSREWCQMVKDAGLKTLRANPYMDRKRYYFFSVLDWLWNRRSRPQGGRWGDRLEPFLGRKEWVRRRLHSRLKALMQSKRFYGPGGAGLVILACKAPAAPPNDSGYSML